MTGARAKKARELHEYLQTYERALWAKGHKFVGGLDEVGAGPLAGPVAAACVVLDPEHTEALIGANDSKKLSEKKREALDEKIREHAIAYSISLVSPKEIDAINIRQASLLAMKRSLEGVQAQLEVDHLLIDARELEGVSVPQTSIIKGDATSLTIAAASILAKVHRDKLMVEAARAYPAYGFEKHKGYGTAEHRRAILEHGPCEIHRRSFSPIREMVS